MAIHEHKPAHAAPIASARQDPRPKPRGLGKPPPGQRAHPRRRFSFSPRWGLHCYPVLVLCYFSFSTPFLYLILAGWVRSRSSIGLSAVRRARGSSAQARVSRPFYAKFTHNLNLGIPASASAKRSAWRCYCCVWIATCAHMAVTSCATRRTRGRLRR